MVISFGYATLAEVAVLGSSRLEKLAGPTDVSRMEESMVVGVKREVVLMVLRRDVARVGGARKIEKQVREEDSDGDSKLGKSSNLGPSFRKVHVLANAHDEQEEDLHALVAMLHPYKHRKTYHNGPVPFMHHIVTEA